MPVPGAHPLSFEGAIHAEPQASGNPGGNLAAWRLGDDGRRLRRRKRLRWRHRERQGHLQRFGADQESDSHRSEEHTSELQSLMRISYAVFCLKKKTTHLTQKDMSTKKHT